MRPQIFLLTMLAMTLTAPTSAQLNTLSGMGPDFHVFTDPTLHAGASPEDVMSQVFAEATEATQVRALSDCGIPLANAESLWNQLVQDSEVAGHAL